MKICTKCSVLKPLSDYFISRERIDGKENSCKLCRRTKQTIKYHGTEYYNVRRRNSFRTIFSYRYISMRNREKGIPKMFKVTGLGILSRDEFLSWCYGLDNLKSFYKIWIAWEKSGYEYKLCPSIDRVDSSKGYLKENLQWLTMSDNSRKQ